MEIKVVDLLGLKEIMENLSRIKTLSGFDTYKVSKLWKKYIDEYNHADKGRLGIFKKNGVEEGDKINIPPEKMIEHSKELSDYLMSNINFDFDTINIKIVDGLSAAEMLILEEFKLIKFEEK